MKLLYLSFVFGVISFLSILLMPGLFSDVLLCLTGLVHGIAVARFVYLDIKLSRSQQSTNEEHNNSNI